MYDENERKQQKVKRNKNIKMFSEVNEHFALSQSVLGDKRHIKLVSHLKVFYFICF